MENKGLNWNEDFLNIMSVIGFAIGLYNLDLNERSLTNDDLAKEVQENRNKIEEQNDKYLIQILENQKKIIELLERK